MSILSFLHVPGGEQAAKFLQGQVTCDVREATEQHNCLGAHCDPKGRVQFIFHLIKQGDDYYLQMLSELIPHAINCLQKYAQFFKIKLAATTNPLFVKGEAIDMTTWKSHNIKAGIPTIYPETIGLFTPHQINLQLIGGVSFNKGCYTGQEIIARMQYLGKLKQHMVRVSFVSEKVFAPGTKLYNLTGLEVGELVDAVLESEQNVQALAVLQDNALAQNIYIGNVGGPILTVLDLPYTHST